MNLSSAIPKGDLISTFFKLDISKGSFLEEESCKLSIGLDFLNLMLRLRHWDVASFCIQLSNIEDR